MSDLNLRVITTGDLGVLEQTLYENSREELHIKTFTAKHNSARNHYEVTICISGCHSPHRLVAQLANEESVRELTPIKSGSRKLF